MAELKEYFQNDFSGDLTIDMSIIITVQLSHNSKVFAKKKIDAQQKLLQDARGGTRLFVFYLPKTVYALKAIKAIVNDLPRWQKKADESLIEVSINYDRTIGEKSIVYSKNIYVYSETNLSDKEFSVLEEELKDSEFNLTIRSQNYLDFKRKKEKPLAFISHDSRNKDLIARPIADGLNSRLCYTWYDEYSMKVGGSLRESIEKGIKEAKKCILIVTPEFLSNSGWSKKEFNSIFTREMIFEESIILPIWYNVSVKEVYDYSPSLADCFAIEWPNKEEFSKDNYDQEVQKIISNLHTIITR